MENTITETIIVKRKPEDIINEQLINELSGTINRNILERIKNDNENIYRV